MTGRIYILLFSAFFTTVSVVKAQEFLSHTHFKYQNILSVCEKIGAAAGSHRPLPRLEVVSQRSARHEIARLQNERIFVDEKLYDVCVARFGADSLHALACIVGHELAHYYENHAWASGFVELLGNDVPLSEGKSMPVSEKIKLEAEADYMGLFYAFLAGFESYRMMPQVLDVVYEAYRLPVRMEGYPSKENRIAIAAEKVKALLPLRHTFNAGQLLYLQEHYEDAAVCFEHIARSFPGKEIYNNLGVIKLKQALEYADKSSVYFAYPFEFDAATRLKAKTRSIFGNERERAQKREQLLHEAEGYLRKAVAMDEAYAAAHINLACTYALLQNPEMAVGTINQLEKRAGGDLPGNAYLIRGIARVQQQQISEALPDFEAAHQHKAYMSAYNLALFKKLDTSWSAYLVEWLTHWSQAEAWIGEFFPAPTYAPQQDILREDRLGKQVMASVTAYPFEEITAITHTERPIIISHFDADSLYALQIEVKDKTIFTLSTYQHYEGATQNGIRQHDALSRIEQIYGQPKTVGAGASGTDFYWYDKAKIIFEVKDQRVLGWTIYRYAF